MGKLFFLCFLGLLCSCDDGDLQIETLDFDDVAIQFCESTVTTSSTIFFKINQDEALVLTLQSGLLNNEETTEELVSSVPSQSQITYRIFSDNVTKNYFCDDIPLAEPTVTNDIEAEGGEVFVSTVLNADGVTYEHTIRLSGISLVTETGDRITDLTINDFGIVTTTL